MREVAGAEREPAAGKGALEEWVPIERAGDELLFHLRQHRLGLVRRVGLQVLGLFLLLGGDPAGARVSPRGRGLCLCHARRAQARRCDKGREPESFPTTDRA